MNICIVFWRKRFSETLMVRRVNHRVELLRKKLVCGYCELATLSIRPPLTGQ